MGILRAREVEEEEDLAELDYYDHRTNAIDGAKLNEGFEKTIPKYTSLSKNFHHYDPYKDDCDRHANACDR